MLLCMCYFFEDLEQWYAFVLNSILSNTRYMVYYSIIFKYANNEFI